MTGSITLTTQGSGGNAAVVDASALDLAASTIGGTLNATATAGDITDSGQLTVTGAATFTAANNQSIYLDNLDSSNVLFGIHTFSSTVSFSSAGTLANVTVRDSTPFDFGAALTLASGGDLIVKSGGDVTQTGGALTVPGTTTIEAASNTVTLSNSSNNFTGAVSINALTVDLEDAGAIVLGASTVTGNYLVTAAGAVTQSGALGVTGTTTISATGQNITLANTSNDFQNSVIVTGANVALVNTDTIDLGTSTLSGTFDVTAKAGNITQSGNLTVTNASTFKTEATNGTILCGNPLCTSAGGTNAFSGAVKLTTTGSSAHAYIDNGTTALEIADETSVAGNLTLVSG
ncbi:hypothetical protein OAL04_09800, partial [Nitrospinae bacterium]|nr:hypothetical protein [Nitrospinota bacterium]